MEASAMPQSRAQADWFYRRSGTIVRSPFMLNSGWFEDGRDGIPRAEPGRRSRQGFRRDG